MNDCRNNIQGNGNRDTRPQSSFVAPLDMTALIGATSRTGRGENRIYPITCPQEQDSSLDVITAIIKVFYL